MDPQIRPKAVMKSAFRKEKSETLMMRSPMYIKKRGMSEEKMPNQSFTSNSAI